MPVRRRGEPAGDRLTRTRRARGYDRRVPVPPAPNDVPAASPDDLAWRTDRFLGEPFEEARLGPATLVRYSPAAPAPAAGDAPRAGGRPPSGTPGLPYLRPEATAEERERALAERGYYLVRIRRDR